MGVVALIVGCLCCYGCVICVVSFVGVCLVLFGWVSACWCGLWMRCCYVLCLDNLGGVFGLLFTLVWFSCYVFVSWFARV